MRWLLSIALLLLAPAAAIAATIHGTVACEGAPQPAFTLVFALDLADYSVVADTLAAANGDYELDAPDDFLAAVLAVPSNGEQVEGWDVSEYLVPFAAVEVGAGSYEVELATAPAYQIVLVGRAGGQITPSADFPYPFIVDAAGQALPLATLGSTNQTQGVDVISYNIPLGTRAAVHFPWELPHAGKIMVQIDNAGAGFGAETQGAQIVDVNREIALTALALFESDLDAATFGVADGETALAAAGAQFDAGAYDKAAGLAIVGAEELALAQARGDAETYRKGELRVEVVDADGSPVPDATVRSAQLDRDFLLGLFGSYEDIGAAAWTQAKADGFNYFTAGVYWNISEPQDDQYAWDELDHHVGIRDIDELGLRIKGHPLVWFMPISEPDYLLDLSYDELLTETQEHVSALVGHYDDAVKRWDVINEAHGYAASGGLTREQITTITRRAVDRVHELDPKATAVINCGFDWYGQQIGAEFYLPGRQGYFSLSIPAYLQGLRDAGVALDVIGQQMYNGGCSTIFEEWGLGPAASVPTFDLAALARMLRRLGAFGLPVHLTEQSIGSAMNDKCPGMTYWRAPWSEQQQAAFLEAWYTLAFGTAAVQAVTYWDFSENGAFMKGGGLLDEANQPRPAYHRLASLFAQWASAENAAADAQGVATLRLYGGTHTITVERDGVQAQQTVYVPEQSQTTLQVVLDGEFGDDDDNDDQTSGDDDDGGGGCGC
jgi:GH35 family endo-1,4-beta-xylanase